nr:hypothetical protein [Tanacetum cinerariifolium]
ESKKLKSSHSTSQPAELQETTSISAGATIAACDPILAVTYVSAGFSVSAASSIPGATLIVAGVSTTAGASGSASETSVPIIELLDSPPKDTSLPMDPETEEQDEPLRKYSRKISIAKKRTLPSPSKPKSDALPFDEDDPEAAFKRYLRQASDDDEPAEPVSLALVSDTTTWEIIPTEFGRGKIHVITRADGTVKREERDASIIWDDQDQWQIRSWRFYAIPVIHVLETKAGDIMYMFVDKKYPLTPATLQRMLNHGLEIDRDPSGLMSKMIVYDGFFCHLALLGTKGGLVFFTDLLKVCRALIMPAWVLNCLAFKLEEIVMAMMTCLKSSGVYYHCFTVKCGLLCTSLMLLVSITVVKQIGGPHETFQCQPMNYFKSNPCYDSNYSGFDQTKPPQYSVNPSLNIQNEPDTHELFISKLIQQKLQNEYAQPFPAIAITFDLPTVEPEDSLRMGDEHLDNISAMKSDKFIKSSVENLIPNPSESQDLSDSEFDVPACDDFTTFFNLLFDAYDDFSSSDDESFSDEDISKKIYSNHLFDEEIISMKIDPHHSNVETNLIKSLLNHDSSITSSSSKIDSLLNEFASELILLKTIL